MSVCCTRLQLFVNTGSGRPRDAPRYHWLLPISCHFHKDCKSASGHESDSCKQRCSKYPTFTFNFGGMTGSPLNTPLNGKDGVGGKLGRKKKRFPRIFLKHENCLWKSVLSILHCVAAVREPRKPICAHSTI